MMINQWIRWCSQGCPFGAQCPRLHLSETFSIILIFHLAWQLHVLLVAVVGVLSQSKRTENPLLGLQMDENAGL